MAPKYFSLAMASLIMFRLIHPNIFQKIDSICQNKPKVGPRFTNSYFSNLFMFLFSILVNPQSLHMNSKSGLFSKYVLILSNSNFIFPYIPFFNLKCYIKSL